jgi:hypothetical protein
VAWGKETIFGEKDGLILAIGFALNSEEWEKFSR